ncbi:hypothetical protein CLCR_05265 [Cladophialophora carrionii]|uniref:Uncharacterized protein n=1 Tax=Cladophialophora carrionii TaxID=86049 RepID=A0A1C1CJH1_9EURO|nr:hypothetical protein CLCR_05265 [Cladophialophora carrionii]
MDSSCEDRAFVLKLVTQSIFELSKELKDEFGDSPHRRTHLDDNEAERVLVYGYYKDNLRSLVKNRTDMPLGARKSILRDLGLGGSKTCTLETGYIQVLFTDEVPTASLLLALPRRF